MMAPERIQELEALLDKATPRPWMSSSLDYSVYATSLTPHKLVVVSSDSDKEGTDTLLITTAINSLPELLAERAGLKKALQDAYVSICKLMSPFDVNTPDSVYDTLDNIWFLLSNEDHATIEKSITDHLKLKEEA